MAIYLYNLNVSLKKDYANMYTVSINHISQWLFLRKMDEEWIFSAHLVKMDFKNGFFLKWISKMDFLKGDGWMKKMDFPRRNPFFFHFYLCRAAVGGRMIKKWIFLEEIHFFPFLSPYGGSIRDLFFPFFLHVFSSVHSWHLRHLFFSGSLNCGMDWSTVWTICVL